MRIVLISYTPIGSSGGVPRFNRDLRAALPEGSCVHYSWWDCANAFGRDPEAQDIPEWDKARILNSWLLQTRRVTSDDIVIADSFWASGLEHLPMCVSHQHGNWGHVTKADRDAGKLPEFPVHERVQTDFRKRYLDAGRKLTTVSDFIADQMMLQWGFPSVVIGNGIDTKKFVPPIEKKKRSRPVIIHFSTTWNKGLDHITELKRSVDADVLLLDEAVSFFSMPKYPALAQADLVVHPSAHEGNSYAVLETLASDVPIVSYDVGLMYTARRENAPVGYVISVVDRCKEETENMVREALDDKNRGDLRPRDWVLRFDLENFRSSWLEYLGKEFGYYTRSA